ncbi:MAG: beta-aspartyl-peptidase (threonine type) [Verrucomicrobiales bacterium]|jgi:beta-aspartyl-peptidase (threonine type)
MKCLLPLVCATILSGSLTFAQDPQEPTEGTGKIALVVHGGAGGLTKYKLSAKREALIRSGIERALKAGYAELEKGNVSMDAVQAAIVVLEDDPHFNAGKGAVKTSAGKHELDASIMNGATLKAGAVGGVTIVKNPIKAARLVIDKTWHVMLAGPGADEFARLNKLELVETNYFNVSVTQAADRDTIAEDYHFGTVGAVALDQKGNIAAGTSTGGLSGKKFGRIGDSPIIGAGTYADNATCGVSGTGQGEYFIRRAIAFDISARMKYAGESLAKATENSIATLTKDGGLGGVIALDKEGNIATPFNTSNMVRGSIDTNGKMVIEIFAD